MGPPPPRRVAAGRHEARRALAKRARPARRPYRTAIAPACGRNVGGGWGRSCRIGLRRFRAGGGLRPRRLDRRLDPRQPRLPIMGAARDHRRDGEATPSVDGPGRRATAGVRGRRPAPGGRPRPPHREPGARLAARRQRSPRPGDERPAVAAAVRRARLRRLVRVGTSTCGSRKARSPRR